MAQNLPNYITVENIINGFYDDFPASFLKKNGIDKIKKRLSDKNLNIEKFAPDA